MDRDDRRDIARLLFEQIIRQQRQPQAESKLPKLLIERVRMLHQAAVPFMLAGSDPVEWFTAAQIVVALEQAREFFWKGSALAMCDVIRRGIDPAVDYTLSIDNQPRWMLFEEPVKTSVGSIAGLLCYCRTDKELLMATIRACKGSGKTFDTAVEALGGFDERTSAQWTLYMYNEAGGAAWQMMLAIEKQKTLWSLDPLFCPDQSCHYTEDRIHINVCQRCAQSAMFWLGWLGTALAMLRGEYRQSAEIEEPQYLTEVETHVERDAKQTWKTRKVNVKHRMRIVQFDASLAKPSKPKVARGPWTAGRDVGEEDALALLDDDAVIYTNIAHKAHTRHFRHARYKAVRGTSRQIDPYTTFTPVTVRYLKARRTAQGEPKPVVVVTAKRFEGSEEGHE